MPNLDKSKMKLVRETRWHREYELDEPNHLFQESKFADGSASITLEQLEREWPTWSAWERIDFCYELSPPGCACMPEVLRFVMQYGDYETWSGIAADIVHHLPREEAVPFLLRVCRNCPPEDASNLSQALAKIGAPEAVSIIRSHLDSLWHNEELSKPAAHINWIASSVTFCIQHLLELGEISSDLAEKYRLLLDHPNESNRQSARNFLSKHFER
jgi:hypothetical protein